MLGGDRHCAQRAAESQRSGVAHEDLRRGGVVPEEPEARPDDRAAKGQQLPRAGDEVHLQVIGELHVADDIGDHPEGGRGDHHRADGEAVQPIGEVHRIGRPDDHHRSEGQVEPAEVQQQFLEQRERQGGVEVVHLAGRPAEPDQHEHRSQGDGELDHQLHRSRDAGGGLLGDLFVVVEEPQEPIAGGHQQGGPDIGVLQVPPEEGGHHQPGQDHEAAHGGRAGLLDDVPLDAVGADRLAAALLGAHPGDEPVAHGGHHQLGGEQREAGPEGQIPQEIQHRDVVSPRRQMLIDDVEHQAAPPGASKAARAAAIWPALEPLDPLTMTTSPGRTASRTSAASSEAVWA